MLPHPSEPSHAGVAEAAADCARLDEPTSDPQQHLLDGQITKSAGAARRPSAAICAACTVIAFGLGYYGGGRFVPSTPTPSPSSIPIFALPDGTSTWRTFQTPMPPVAADRRACWRDEATTASASARARLRDKLEAWLSPERGAKWDAALGQWLPLGNASNARLVADVCAAIEEALPLAGVNGVVHLALEEWQRLVTSQYRPSALTEHLPVRVDGVAVSDLNHLVGALATSAAWRRGAGREAALDSTIALAADTVGAPGRAQTQAAALHAAVWQRAVATAGRGASMEHYWQGAQQLCEPMLNEWSFVQCLHGVGHGAVKLALMRLQEEEDAAIGGRASWTAGCAAVARTPAFGDRAFAAATRACDAAPTRGAAHACGFSLWMDIYDQHMVLGAWQAYASLPTAPWLEVDLRGEGAAAATSTHTIRAPCDTAASPAACFARHFHKPLLAPRPGKAPMAPLPLAAHCVAEPMASERHVVGCVFGVSLNAYPRQLGTRGALAAWCSVFVERAARARPDAVPSEERARQTRRFHGCIAGCMFGLGFGVIAPERLPAWTVDAHCESELDEATTAGWLSADEREHARRVCRDAGTLCSASGSACASNVGFPWASVAAVLDE